MYLRFFFFLSFILADFFLSLCFVFLLCSAQNPFPQNHAARLKIWLWVRDCCGGGGWVCSRDFFFHRVFWVCSLISAWVWWFAPISAWWWSRGCDWAVGVVVGLPILRCLWRGWLIDGSLGWWFAPILVDWGGRQEMRREKKKVKIK